MIKEALQHIGQQALDAQPQYFKVAGEPDHVYFLRNNEGFYEEMHAEPKPRAYAAATVMDFTDLVQAGMRHKYRIGEQVAGGAIPPAEPLLMRTTGPAMVMIGERAIVGLLDEFERRERIVFPLKMSKACATLLACEMTRKEKDQDDFVSMLRVDLHGCVEKDLVATFRSVRFTSSADNTSQVDNSQKGVSRKLQMELVAGGNPIPDEIEVRVNVFDEFPGCITVVRCAIQTVIEAQAFAMIPLAGELLKARNEAANYIRDDVIARLKPHVENGTVLVHCGEVNC